MLFSGFLKDPTQRIDIECVGCTDHGLGIYCLNLFDVEFVLSEN